MTPDFPFLEPRHGDLADELSRFAAEKIETRAAAAAGSSDGVDEASLELLQSCAAAGWLRLLVPDGYGGTSEQPDLRSVCLAREALARASAVADAVFAVQGLGSYPIAVFGDDTLKRRFLPSVARGEEVAAFALTEPEAGSDAAALRTRASKVDGGYALDGVKTFISNAPIASFFVVFARTSEDSRKGISAFLVKSGTPGLRIGRTLDLLAPHSIADVTFEACLVPVGHRLSTEGAGLKVALATLDFFRASVGAAACGLARRALDETLARVKERRQFGAALADFQLTKAALADMATELDAARLLVYRAAWLKDCRGRRVTREASMAKLFATEAAQRIIDRAVQLHGGRGLQRGSAVERLYREVRALRIYEGTSEIQRLIIGDHLLKTAD